MFNFISSFYNYVKLFINIGLFTFIFKMCLDTCVEKVNIKSKSGKNKQTIRARIGVALTYLTMCGLLYFSLTPRVIFTLLGIIGLITLYALDRFNKPLVEKLCLYDKNKSVRFTWKLLYTLINIILIIYTPIHNFFTSKFGGVFGRSKAKSNLFGKMSGDLKALDDIIGAGANVGHDIKKVIHELTSDNKNDEPSSMGDYLNKTEKSKTIGENQKVIIEETSTDINNEMTTEVENVNFAVKLDSSEIEDFEKFNKIIKDEISNTELVEEPTDKTIDENIQIDNTEIDKKAESERLLKLFKKMNDIFSTEEQSSNIDDTTETTD